MIKSLLKIFTGNRHNLTPFDGVALTTAAGATASIPLSLSDIKPNGYFSIQVTTASVGGGTLKVQYQCSNDGQNFSVPHDKDGNEVDDVVVAHTAGQTNIYPLTPLVSKEVRLLITAATADLEEVTIKICAQ